MSAINHLQQECVRFLRRTYTPFRCRAPCRGLLRSPSAMGVDTPKPPHPRQKLTPTARLSLSGGANIRIQMQDLEMEEKVRLWTVPNAAYRTSLFYNAGPVEIQSVRKKSVKRVMEINYRFAGKET